MNEAANDQNNEIETNEEELSVEETIEALSEPENDPIAQLTKERDDMRDKMMRALAEAENTRKRAEKAQQDTYIWLIKYREMNEAGLKTKRGHVNLIR